MCAALLVLFTPIITQATMMIMLEVPVLAMGFLMIFLYFRLVRSQELTWPKLLWFVGVSTAAVYTKQPIVFLFPSLMLDVAMNHRVLLRDVRFWIAAALLMLFLLPLAVFTMTLGHVGLEQSFGNDKSVIYSFHPPDRWTVEAWTYYVRLLPTLLNPVVLALGISGLMYGVVYRPFLRANLVWFAWVVCWWLMFSWFLNKQPRYAALWVPGWVMLASAFIFDLASRYKRLKLAAYAAVVVALIIGGWSASGLKPRGFRGMEAIMQTIITGERVGNIVYFGDMRQLFVPYVRMLDSSRSIHVLQGDDVAAETPDIMQVCHDYRVAYVMAEGDEHVIPAAMAERLHSENLFRRVLDTHIDTEKGQLRISVYRYTGAMADEMHEIPLRSNIVDKNMINRLQ
jgi:hypothetical protein